MKDSRNSFLDLNEHLSLINPVMRPDQVRPGDLITCSILGKAKNELRLWSYCPFGFEIETDTPTAESFPIRSLYEFKFGSEVFEAEGALVFKREPSVNGKQILGIRLSYESKKSSENEIEKRSSLRWGCPEHLLPTGTAANPIRFNDYIFFRVVDASSKGLKIATSMRNKFLIIGQVLECTLSVPMIGSCTATVRINRCNVENVFGKDHLVLGVSFINADEVTVSTLSEYLLTFAENCSVKSLREAGFQVQGASEKFDFSYVKSQNDYEAVLDLRYQAYQASGKASKTVTREFMRDEYDTRARILIVKVGGKIVGSARAMFHENGDKTSHERYLTYPTDFPKNNLCIEVSRVCVLPEFQEVGLASELAKHLALLAVKSGRAYCYLSAAGDLIPFWKKLGYAELGINYIHQDLGGLKHELMLNKVEDTILGRNIAPKQWFKSYSGLYNYCTEFGFITPSLKDEIRNRITRLLSFN